MFSRKRIVLSLVVVCSSIVGALSPVHAKPEHDLEERFHRIWEGNHWQSEESRSGPGSTIEATTYVRKGIEKLVKSFQIESVLDVACGDFGWMSEVNLQGASYHGIDIVPGLVEQVKEQWEDESQNRTFAVGDMVYGELPKADLVIARDVFGHLSFAHGLEALRNIRRSGAKYFLSTTFIGGRGNYDIADGDWRPVNLSGAPYNLGTPERVVIEHCNVANGSVADKSLGLWKIESLPE